MPDTLIIILFFVVIGVIYLIVSSIGNKIVDKGSDAISNKIKHKKNAESVGKEENLADRYRK